MPLSIKFATINHLMIAIARLNNHCIRVGIQNKSGNLGSHDILQVLQTIELSPYYVYFRETAANVVQLFGFTRPNTNQRTHFKLYIFY